MAMTWKKIEASRERRLWLTQVVIPTLMACVVLYQVPEVRVQVNKAVESAVDCAKKTKEKVSDFFKKQ